MDIGSSTVRDYAGRMAIVAVFTHGATLAVLAILQQVSESWPPNSMADGLQVASRLASFIFLMMVVMTTTFRLRPIQAASGWEPRITALLGTYALLILPAVSPGGAVHPAFAAVGFFLLLAGFALSAYVIVWLGRSFSIMAEARKLVSDGPYAIVRHPLYMTEEVAVVGTFLLNISVMTALLVAVHWLLQLRRMHHEEQVLRDAFPEYDTYAMRTPKILPRLPAFLIRKAS